MYESTTRQIINDLGAEYTFDPDFDSVFRVTLHNTGLRDCSGHYPPRQAFIGSSGIGQIGIGVDIQAVIGAMGYRSHDLRWVVSLA